MVEQQHFYYAPVVRVFSAYVLLGNDGGVLAGLPSLSGPGMMDREKLIWPFRWRMERETERPSPQSGP